MRLATARLITALVVAAIAGPAAAARPETGTVGPPILRAPQAVELPALHRAEEQQQRERGYSPPSRAQVSSASYNAYLRSRHPAVAAAPSAKAPSDGFDYGAAAIGAAITATISLVLSGGIVAVRRRSQLQHT